VPTWVDTNCDWFITIACAPRGLNQLAKPEVKEAIAGAIEHYSKANRLEPRVWVAMPDHLHLIAKFDHRRGMAATLTSFKRHLAGSAGVRWQRGFFDHRLRSATEVEAKSMYVRMNPVRAGLVAHPEDWPYRGEREGANQQEGNGQGRFG